jgi:pilus assembly protein Flp/PilA
MQAFLNRAKSFLKSEDGPTATEYAVMLALIIVVALTAIQTLGTSVQGVFTDVNTGITG